MMSNLEHELMAAERALRAIAEMTGAQYVCFSFYRDVTPFQINIHNGYKSRSAHQDALSDALERALAKEPFDATPKVETAA